VGGQVFTMADFKFKTKCQELRQQGFSLNEIIIATGKPKTSVYFHIKNIPVAVKRREEFIRVSTERIVALNRSRKGVSNRTFNQFTGWTPCSVSLLAHLIFDGSIRYYGCVYYNRNNALIRHVQTCFKAIYNFPPSVYYWKEVERICYSNVALAAYMHTKANSLLLEIEKLPIELKRTFLRAFYDDEGSVRFQGTMRAVRGYQHNLAILVLIQKLLQDFGIESSIQGTIEIVISKKKNLDLFAAEINFSPGVCVNGNRSNSVWKESLEKREILRRALASYGQGTIVADQERSRRHQ